MDVQLKELIETIKSEGVENAEAKAKEILSDAESRKNTILKDAEQEAARIREKAEEDAARMKATAEESIRQAGRDLILSLEKSITVILDKVVKREVKGSLKGDNLKSAILTLLSNWKEDKDSLELLLAKDDLEQVEKQLLSELQKELKSGVTLKPAPDIDAGFLISEKEGNAYYNFSSEGIAEILSQYVNPRLSQLLRESSKETAE
jgi:V/A-type H+/Na+-transporting ATPase subunit E